MTKEIRRGWRWEYQQFVYENQCKPEWYLTKANKTKNKINKQTNKTGQSRNLCSVKIYFKNEGENYRLTKANSLSEELYYKNIKSNSIYWRKIIHIHTKKCNFPEIVNMWVNMKDISSLYIFQR